MKPAKWKRELDERADALIERERARRPGYDPTIRVRRVDPATLKPPRVKAKRVTRAPLTAEQQAVVPRERVRRVDEPQRRWSHQPPPPTTMRGRILDWLTRNGPATGPEIAFALHLTTAQVGVALVTLGKRGYTRRTGQTFPHPRSRPVVEWEAVPETRS